MSEKEKKVTIFDRDKPSEVNTTYKQEKFCRLYIKYEGNATKAAQEAGYSSPRQQGTENLAKPYIRQRLQELINDMTLYEKLTPQYIARQIMEIADDAKAKNKQQVALKAYELLGRHLAMFTDRVEEEKTVNVHQYLIEKIKEIEAKKADE